MSTIESLTLWNEGVIKMEKKDFSGALTIFDKVPERSAKILFNSSACKVTLGLMSESLEYAEEALTKDEHMAVGYYVRGIINFKLNRFKEASNDFETAHSKLRGRNHIDYNQLGLRYKLYACEPLHNAGVSWGAQGNRPKAMDYLWQANRCKVEAKHAVIDKNINTVDSGQRAEILTVPFPDMIYRPPKNKLANLQKKDYLGKAKVITTIDSSDDKPGFEAPRKMSQGLLTVDVSAIKHKSAPNSPSAIRKSKPASVNPPVSLLEKVNEGANKLKYMLPGGLKLSKSDTNIGDRSNEGRKSIPSVPNKALPPPPNKPIPQPPLQTSRRSKPLPPKPEVDQYMYAVETNQLADRLKNLHQTEKQHCEDTVEPYLQSSPQVLQSKENFKPHIIISDSARVNDQDDCSRKKLPLIRHKKEGESEDEYPPLPPKLFTTKPTSNLPPKPSVKAIDTVITVEIICNGSLSFQIKKGTTLESLQGMACTGFTLEPGTINLWFKRASDDDFVCIENEDIMTRLWAGVKDSLTLWCFSRD